MAWVGGGFLNSLRFEGLCLVKLAFAGDPALYCFRYFGRELAESAVTI